MFCSKLVKAVRKTKGKDLSVLLLPCGVGESVYGGQIWIKHVMTLSGDGFAM